MSAFEHVAALLSFVYALALTHLLSRITELVVARDRVRFSGLLALAMANAVVLVFANWLSLWDLHSVTSWDLASIVVQFAFAVSVYLICAVAGPKASDEGQSISKISSGDNGLIFMALSCPASYWLCSPISIFSKHPMPRYS